MTFENAIAAITKVANKQGVVLNELCRKLLQDEGLGIPSSISETIEGVKVSPLSAKGIALEFAGTIFSGVKNGEEIVFRGKDDNGTLVPVMKARFSASEGIEYIMLR